MPALQYGAAFTNKRPHPLPVAQVRPLLNPVFGALGRSSKGTEYRCVSAKVDGIIAPVSCSDHASVEVQYLGEFNAVKADLI
jgi:hypothetical protein